MLTFILAAALACVPPAAPPKGAPAHATYTTDIMPPERYRADGRATIVTHGPAAVARICDEGPPTCGFVTEACTVPDRGGGVVIHMPNPCGREFAGQSYARLECHERAHAAGWPSWHGD